MPRWNCGLTRRRSCRGPASVRQPSCLVQRKRDGVTPPASRASHAGRRRAASASARGPWPRSLAPSPLGRPSPYGRRLPPPARLSWSRSAPSEHPSLLLSAENAGPLRGQTTRVLIGRRFCVLLPMRIERECRSMFCPKCGDTLEARGETLVCVRGDMPLSRRMHDGLTETFLSGTETVPSRSLVRAVGGTWYCPSDRTVMIETDGYVLCPSFGRNLNCFVHALIELHPHLRVSSETSQSNGRSYEGGNTQAAVRIWSPVAVGVYGLLLGYPSALLLAVRNWQVLRRETRIATHVLIAIAALPIIASGSIYPQAERIIALGVNIATFTYFRERLRSDIADFRQSNPSETIQIRPWYGAIGWTLLPLAIILVWGRDNRGSRCPIPGTQLTPYATLAVVRPNSR